MFMLRDMFSPECFFFWPQTCILNCGEATLGENKQTQQFAFTGFLTLQRFRFLLSGTKYGC